MRIATEILPVAIAMMQNVWDAQLILVVSSSCAGLRDTTWRVPPLAAYTVKKAEKAIVRVWVCNRH